MRSPSRRARSRLTRVPAASRPSVVRRSVSGETSTVKRFPARRVTVRQAPFTETLSPTSSSRSRRGVAIVSRAPLPLGRRSSSRPIVWMIPVNTARYRRGRWKKRPSQESRSPAASPSTSAWSSHSPCPAGHSAAVVP